jgi:oligopeptide/dipeptide ABC transporter ATP-binding protein
MNTLEFMAPLLEVKGLKATYITRKGTVRALRGVNLKVFKGERLAIVGESGSGKSTLASIMSRLEEVNLRVEGGELLFKGENLLTMGKEALRELRKRNISVVFQNPSESLNPLYTIGDQVVEALKSSRHHKFDRGDLRREAIQLLKKVGLTTPERIFDSYPHELSGGQKQRVAIAIAIAKEPELLIADEPTTALDVSVQAKILELLIKINEELGITEILITHDIGVASDFAHRIAVMYGGKIVEVGRAQEVIDSPLHPYTAHLINSVPKDGRLPPGEASTVDYRLPEKGCPYMPRCPKAVKGVCDEVNPELVDVGDGRQVACHQASLLKV